MRLTLVAGALVGLSVAARLAPAEVNGSNTKEDIKVSKTVTEHLRHFRAGSDDRKLEHEAETEFTRVTNLRGVEMLAQTFTVGPDFYRAAVAVGGHEDLGGIVKIGNPLPGTLLASSPWVNVERRNDLGVETQTLAIGFRKVRELGRGDELRLVRVQRDYFLAGFGGGVRVRAEGTDEITGLRVETNDGTGLFTGTDVMLGKILAFRATPTHLYVFTSNYVGYELAMTAIDGQLTFASGRQFAEVSDQLKAQAQKVSDGVVRTAACKPELTPTP